MKSSSERATPSAHPPATPQAEMLDLVVAYWTSCAIHVACRLGVADGLAGGPRTVEELARSSGADARSLFRLLRMLACRGVFAERTDGRFENTPLSETLRADVPGSMRGFAVMMIDAYNLQAWAELRHSVDTGEPVFERVLGAPVFEYFASHPERAREFGEAMASLSATENPAVAAACDLTGAKSLVDVGGSLGHMLAAILERNPGVRGVLYDRPEVIQNARKAPHLARAGIAERCELVAGDFFEEVPRGKDAYAMKYILHDWDDERCVRILTNCAQAMAPRGKVLAVDNVIPPGNAPHWGKLLDVNMLALTGGRERTEAEFAELFAAAGLRLARVIPTACPLSVVEGVRA